MSDGASTISCAALLAKESLQLIVDLRSYDADPSLENRDKRRASRARVDAAKLAFDKAKEDRDEQ